MKQAGMEYLVSMKSVKKVYGQTEVLHGVDFDVIKGEVHALVGENGAGKSTLMKILMGETGMTAGNIVIDGKEIRNMNPAEAHRLGLVMIHQEISLIPDMTVADNIFIGRELRRCGLLQKKRQRIMAQAALRELELDIPEYTVVRSLKTAQQQMVEIAAAVSCGARLIIMDEPTSSISQRETDKLFEIIGKLKAKGISFVYISHRLEEIFQIADRVTVFRDGGHISAGAVKDYSRDKLIGQMVGRKLTEYYPEASETGEKHQDVIFAVSGISRKNEFEDISFEVHRGEILGIAGLVGAGRTEMAMAIFGNTRLDRGEIYVHGRQVRIHSPGEAVKNKIALIPEDRKIVGLNLIGSISDNILEVVEKRISSHFLIRRRKRNELSGEMINRLSIKAESKEQPASSLSGGNQQKVVLAKWLLSEPDVIILDEPTRGIDVGSKAEIYRLIRNMANTGKAVIFISSDMPELIGMCDRAVVLCEGRLTGEVSRAEMTQERIMYYASGFR